MLNIWTRVWNIKNNDVMGGANCTARTARTARSRTPLLYTTFQCDQNMLLPLLVKLFSTLLRSFLKL